jgi:transposase
MPAIRFAGGYEVWTDENRARYDRSKLRYPSDLTDEEWGLIGPLIPPAKPGGNARTVVVREVVNGLMYILGTGCQWSALPKDLPPRSTVNDYFRRWSDDGTLDRIHHALYVQCRELAGREASPTVAIIDSQSVKSSEKGGVSIDPHGYDAGKKIKGKKRHIAVDTQGLLLLSIVHGADMQDRDGGVLLMSLMFGLFPFLLKLYADSGYQGPQFRDGMKRVCEQINVEIVKRCDVGKFVVLPKRWIVERTIAWLNRCRRLAKDWECLNSNGLAFLRWASVRLMVRKLCKDSK